jgi:CysZ protein
MAPIPRALLKALVSLLHPKMLLLMVLPVVAAVGLWAIAAIAFWSQAVAWLDAQMRGWEALQWILAYWPLTLVAAHAAWILLIALMVPVVIVTSVLVVGMFAMPLMVSHVAARHYAQLDERRGGTFIASVWNSVAAMAWFAALALVTSPLWLFPPLWPLLSLGLLGYLNQRVFRFDALAAHASTDEIAQIVGSARVSLFILGMFVALAAHVPLLGFFAPVYGGLAFIHFLLDRLRALREAPLEGQWTRVAG